MSCVRASREGGGIGLTPGQAADDEGKKMFGWAQTNYIPTHPHRKGIKRDVLHNDGRYWLSAHGLLQRHVPQSVAALCSPPLLVSVPLLSSSCSK